jgi:hypothetical protein
MPNIIEDDPLNPKTIYDNLIERCKQAREWYVTCYIEEEWVPVGKSLPFDMNIVNGIVFCKVICETYKQAQILVSDFLPVIKFVDVPEDNE